MIKHRRALFLSAGLGVGGAIVACHSSSSGGGGLGTFDAGTGDSSLEPSDAASTPDSNPAAPEDASKSGGDGGVPPSTDGAASPDAAPDTGAPPTMDAGVDAGAGAVTVLAQGIDAPYNIAVDSTYVYVSELTTPGRVLRTPIAGGPLDVLASNLQNPSGIASDGTYLYVGEGITGNVYRIPTSGPADGGVPPVWQATGQQGVSSMAVDALHAYFGTGNMGVIFWCPTAATAPNSVSAFAGGPDDNGVTIDSLYVYWGNYDDGSVMREVLGMDGGGAFAMLPAGYGFSKVTNIAPSPSALYFGASSTMAMGAGIFSTPNTFALHPGYSTLTTADSPSKIVADANYVYWLSLGNSPVGILKVPVGGGTPITVMPSTDYQRAITMDANYLYVTTDVNGDSHNGAVLRVAK